MAGRAGDWLRTSHGYTASDNFGDEQVEGRGSELGGGDHEGLGASMRLTNSIPCSQKHGASQIGRRGVVSPVLADGLVRYAVEYVDSDERDTPSNERVPLSRSSITVARTGKLLGLLFPRGAAY
jgi:hypothetical protein